MSKQPIIGRQDSSDDQFDSEETGGELPVLGNAEYVGSKEEDVLLRPKRMLEMVGQREVFERLLIAIEAAKKRKEPLGHILFDGPPGLGKTTFATCIPRELGVPFQIGNGATLRAPKDVLPYLTNAKEGSVLFIDEIHRMQKTVEEFIYPAMEDFRVDMTMGEGVGARTINIPLEHFTLIGATTRTGLISAPLRDRFTIREHLGFYSTDELAEIVRRNAEKLNVYIDTAGAFEIATRSRGTPRLANNRLRWVRDFADARADGKITLDVAKRALEMQGVDEIGLDSQDRQYMETLIGVFEGGPAGVEAIAHTINLAPDTLVDEVEPFLLRSQLIVRTPRGRRITTKGLIHLGYDPGKFDLSNPFGPDTSGQPTLFD
ncbi:MAG: Holliday junction branch migration DNA helicase RuvB [Planctomycetia bacterium]|nr:Holliday junction branch migration DNA helicase RuvB [Planctomycetia bacterium]